MLWELQRIHSRLDHVVKNMTQIRKTEAIQLAALDDILAKVRAQKTLLDGVKAFIEELRNNANDPVKLAEIVAELDANTLTIDLLDGVETPPVEG